MAVLTAELVREEVRAWLAENWDPDLTLAQWWDRLAESGWAVPTWPEEWHGKGFTRDLAAAVADEIAAAGDLVKGKARQLPVALVRTEIDRRAHGGRAHIVSFAHGAKQNLVKLVRISQQLIVIDLHDEGNVVRVLASHNAQHSKRRRHRVAAAFDSKLDNVLRLKIHRIGRKRRTC